MKIRSLLSLVGLAISFAMPVFAEVQTAVDPEVRQQIEAAFTKYHEAYNKYDAAAVADFYTLNAIEYLGRRVWLWVSKPSKRGMQSCSRRSQPSSHLSLFTCLQSTTTYVRSRISVIIPLKRATI